MMAYSGGGGHEWAKSPQWMRSMEDKYQRLHARISDQALKFSQTRNGLASRLRELRQRRYCQKITPHNREGSATAQDRPTPNHNPCSQSSTIHVDSQTQMNCAHDAVGDVKIKRPQTHFDARSSLLDDLEYDKEDSKVLVGKKIRSRQRRSISAIPVTQASADIEPVGNTTVSDNANTNNNAQGRESPSDLQQASNVLDLSGQETVVRSEKGDERLTLVEHIVGKDTKAVDKDKICNTKDNIKCSESERVEDVTDTGIKKTEENSLPTVKTIRKHHRKVANTGVHDIGQSQWKSPTKQQKTHEVSARQTAPSSLRRRNSVFARMSLEAQHAVGETMKELSITEDSQKDKRKTRGQIKGNSDLSNQPGGADFETAQENESIGDKGEKGSPPNGEVNENSASSEMSGNRNEDCKSSATAPCSRPLCPRDNSKEVSKMDKRTIGAHPPWQKKVRGKTAPLISTQSFNHSSAPLPAIRQSRTSGWGELRDDSFNITSPEFDVRFHEFAAKREDNEPPFEEIRKQSIEKCRLWLLQNLKAP